MQPQRFASTSKDEQDNLLMLSAIQITPDMPEAAGETEDEYVGFWLTTDANGNKGRVPDALFKEHFTLVKG